jgi:hypothetical protein
MSIQDVSTFLGVEVNQAMSKQYRVKPFTNGGSQAIRIPAEFRFEGDVIIEQNPVTKELLLRGLSTKPFARLLEVIAQNPELQDLEFPTRVSSPVRYVFGQASEAASTQAETGASQS